MTAIVPEGTVAWGLQLPIQAQSTIFVGIIGIVVPVLPGALLSLAAILIWRLLPARMHWRSTVWRTPWNGLLRIVRPVRMCSTPLATKPTSPSIGAAIVELDRRGLDVIAIVRGGGARTDLAAFDHATIARAIATSATPGTVASCWRTNESWMSRSSPRS